MREAFGEKRQELVDKDRAISENIYKIYARNGTHILYQYFPYCKLIRNYENYHFHFLVIRKIYIMNVLFEGRIIVHFKIEKIEKIGNFFFFFL